MGRYDEIPLGNQLAFSYPPFDVLGQPKWQVPEIVVIEAAISGDHYQDPVRNQGAQNARDRAREEALLAAGAGASAIHFSAYDKDDVRSGKLEDYRHLVDACKERYLYREVRWQHEDARFCSSDSSAAACATAPCVENPHHLFQNLACRDRFAGTFLFCLLFFVCAITAKLLKFQLFSHLVNEAHIDDFIVCNRLFENACFAHDGLAG